MKLNVRIAEQYLQWMNQSMLKSFYMMYANDDITLDDLRVLTELVGWHFTEEFETMSEADKKTKGLSQEDE